MTLSRRSVCERPPKGWTCSREPGHVGPCAASPTPPEFCRCNWPGVIKCAPCQRQEVKHLRETVADLDRLVCEFCTAVGEPVPEDAIAAARRLREALGEIAAFASGGAGAEASDSGALAGVLGRIERLASDAGKDPP